MRSRRSKILVHFALTPLTTAGCSPNAFKWYFESHFLFVFYLVKSEWKRCAPAYINRVSHFVFLFRFIRRRYLCARCALCVVRRVRWSMRRVPLNFVVVKRSRWQNRQRIIHIRCENEILPVIILRCATFCWFWPFCTFVFLHRIGMTSAGQHKIRFISYGVLFVRNANVDRETGKCEN